MKFIKLFLFVLLSVSAIQVSAQKETIKFSVGGELAAVTGDLNKLYSFAVGGSAQVDIKVMSDLSLTAHAGIIALAGKDIPGTNLKYKSTTYIPLLAGAKYYFTPKIYGSGQLGASFSTRSGGGSTFTYAPGIGVKLNEQLDALLKYTGYDNGGTFGVRVAYTF